MGSPCNTFNMLNASDLNMYMQILASVLGIGKLSLTCFQYMAPDLGIWQNSELTLASLRHSSLVCILVILVYTV